MMTTAEQRNILFLCTGNSCRSQMAEGMTNALMSDEFQAYSAGVSPSSLDSRAVRVMAELGIEIGGYSSKDISELPQVEFHWVVTLCSHAAENCPYFPGNVRRAHRSFDDPPLLAAGAKSEAEALAPYRLVRDQIKAMVLGMPASLED